MPLSVTACACVYALAYHHLGQTLLLQGPGLIPPVVSQTSHLYLGHRGPSFGIESLSEVQTPSHLPANGHLLFMDPRQLTLPLQEPVRLPCPLQSYIVTIPAALGFSCLDLAWFITFLCSISLRWFPGLSPLCVQSAVLPVHMTVYFLV